MSVPNCLSLIAAALLPAALFLQGCQPSGSGSGTANILQSIEVDNAVPPSVGADIKFIIRGMGTCHRTTFDWGDGTPNDQVTLDLTRGADTVEHRFTGWPGGKTVSATGGTGVATQDACLGSDTVRFTTQPAFAIIGVAGQGTQACNVPTPSFGAVSPGWLIQIRNTLLANWPGGINFGCPFRNCVFDAHGSDEALADASFPFPGLRRYSLVLRIGSSSSSTPPQIVQGDTDLQFTATRQGALEFCLNDIDVTNNDGGYQLEVRVDQLGR
jgi:hypothetical protein